VGDGFGWQLDYPYNSYPFCRDEEIKHQAPKNKQISLTNYNNTNISPKEEINKTTRNYKGYSFEINECRRAFVDIPNIVYQSNPTDYNEWLMNHSKNSYDATVTYPNGVIQKIEMKFVTNGVKIESSWFRRDWISRDADIIVTNNPNAIKFSDRRTAEKLGIKIMSVSEAKVYISKKIYKMLHPNQLSSWNSLIDTIIIGILDSSSKIIIKLSHFKFRIRLKTSLLELKSSFGARLSNCNLEAISKTAILKKTS
jgi:hypothetical protein